MCSVLGFCLAVILELLSTVLYIYLYLSELVTEQTLHILFNGLELQICNLNNSLPLSSTYLLRFLFCYVLRYVIEVKFVQVSYTPLIVRGSLVGLKPKGLIMLREKRFSDFHYFTKEV